MQARLCVVGSFNADLTATVASFPRPGETITAARFNESCGGKGSNQAIAAARCGAEVAMIAALGTDAAGDKAVALWRGGGVGAGAPPPPEGGPPRCAPLLGGWPGGNQSVLVSPAHPTPGRAPIEAGGGG